MRRGMAALWESRETGQSISHIQLFCGARLSKETGNEIVTTSALCPIVCRELLLGSKPAIL